MTERLSVLLHREADREQVPTADLDAVLRRAGGLRRRRRVGQALTVGVVCAAMATVGALAFRPPAATHAERQFADTPAAAAYRQYGAFSVGRTVYVGNHHVTFEEKVKALYYTSEGVLVRGGRVAETDASGPSHYTLVRPDGSARDIDLKMGDRVTGTDPDSPNVAYAARSGDRWSLVVVSLVSGKEIARTQVDADFTWGGWEAPPVDLAGDKMWALFDNGWVEYDWRTGTVRRTPGSRTTDLESAHGRFAEEHPPQWVVKDFETGEVLRTVTPRDPDLGGMLSPDGRYGRIMDDYLSTDGKAPATRARIVTIDTGKIVTLPGGRQYGWTPDGHVLSVNAARDLVTVCDPATGSCDDIHVDIDGDGRVKLGGLLYES